MKRLLLATIILTSGTSLWSHLRNLTLQVRHQATDGSQTLLMQTQLVAQAQVELVNFQERVHELERTLESRWSETALPPSNSLLYLTGARRISPEQSEQLLAALGFNWSSSGDCVIVSKDTLHAISVEGIRGMKLGNAACAVLAITPEECASIEGMTVALGETYKTWVAGHVQREEPSGDVVAKYTLPADPAFSQSLSNNFASGVLSTIGNERGNLLLEYSQSSMMDLGLDGAGNSSLTLTRYQAGEESRLGLVFKDASGNSMSTDVAPYQPVPEAFRPLFPNGWVDLAKREGFQLPKEFSSQGQPR